MCLLDYNTKSQEQSPKPFVIDEKFIPEFFQAKYGQDSIERVRLEDVKQECLDSKQLKEVAKECGIYKVDYDTGVRWYRDYKVKITEPLSVPLKNKEDIISNLEVIEVRVWSEFRTQKEFS